MLTCFQIFCDFISVFLLHSRCNFSQSNLLIDVSFNEHFFIKVRWLNEQTVPSGIKCLPSLMDICNIREVVGALLDFKENIMVHTIDYKSSNFCAHKEPQKDIHSFHSLRVVREHQIKIKRGNIGYICGNFDQKQIQCTQPTQHAERNTRLL